MSPFYLFSRGCRRGEDGTYQRGVTVPSPQPSQGYAIVTDARDGRGAPEGFLRLVSSVESKPKANAPALTQTLTLRNSSRSKAISMTSHEILGAFKLTIIVKKFIILRVRVV